MIIIGVNGDASNEMLAQLEAANLLGSLLGRLLLIRLHLRPAQTLAKRSRIFTCSMG